MKDKLLILIVKILVRFYSRFRLVETTESISRDYHFKKEYDVDNATKKFRYLEDQILKTNIENNSVYLEIKECNEAENTRLNVLKKRFEIIGK